MKIHELDGFSQITKLLNSDGRGVNKIEKLLSNLITDSDVKKHYYELDRNSLVEQTSKYLDIMYKIVLSDDVKDKLRDIEITHLSIFHLVIIKKGCDKIIIKYDDINNLDYYLDENESETRILLSDILNQASKLQSLDISNTYYNDFRNNIISYLGGSREKVKSLRISEISYSIINDIFNDLGYKLNFIEDVLYASEHRYDNTEYAIFSYMGIRYGIIFNQNGDDEWNEMVISLIDNEDNFYIELNSFVVQNKIRQKLIPNITLKSVEEILDNFGVKYQMSNEIINFYKVLENGIIYFEYNNIRFGIWEKSDGVEIFYCGNKN